MYIRAIQKQLSDFWLEHFRDEPNGAVGATLEFQREQPSLASRAEAASLSASDIHLCERGAPAADSATASGHQEASIRSTPQEKLFSARATSRGRFKKRAEHARLLERRSRRPHEQLHELHNIVHRGRGTR